MHCQADNKEECRDYYDSQEEDSQDGKEESPGARTNCAFGSFSPQETETSAEDAQTGAEAETTGDAADCDRMTLGVSVGVPKNIFEHMVSDSVSGRLDSALLTSHFLLPPGQRKKTCHGHSYWKQKYSGRPL